MEQNEYKIIFENGEEEIVMAADYAEMSKEAVKLSNKKGVYIKEVWIKCAKVGL